MMAIVKAQRRPSILAGYFCCDKYLLDEEEEGRLHLQIGEAYAVHGESTTYAY
jgi:hypothetical protein